MFCILCAIYIDRYIVIFLKLINTLFICANGHEGEGNTGDEEALGMDGV